MALVTIAYTLSAVVPLVLTPTGTVADVVRDPVSRPLWLLIAMYTALMTQRFSIEIVAVARANLPIVALCAVALLSVGWSDIPSLTLLYALQLLQMTLFGFYLGARFGVRGIVALVGWVMFVVLILSTFFALGFPTFGLDALHDDRWRGVFMTKNELGRAMVIGGVAWGSRLFAGETSRALGATVVVAFVSVGWLSGSRSALAVTVAVLGFALLASPSSRLGAALIPIRGLMVSLLALVVLLGWTAQTHLLDLVGADATLTGRTDIWSAVWTSIQRHPGLGYGYDAFWRGADGPSLYVWRTSGIPTPHSHNGFLDLALALGVVGLVLILVAIAIVFVRSLEALYVGTGTARVYPFLVVAFLVLYNLTESSLVERRSILWLLFTSIAAALPLRDDERVDTGAPGVRP